MAKLTGQTIASSYDQLLIVGHADGISSSLQGVESGDTGGEVSALQISTVGAAIDNPTASSATQGGKLTLFSDDGAVMASGHRLGVIEFGGAEDTSSTITVGARIEALTDATWSASENGADLVFYTTDGNASETEAMRMTAESNVELLSGRFQVKHAGTDTGLVGAGMEIHGGTSPVLLAYNRGGGAYLPMVFDALNYTVKVSNTARMVVDANSRISLSNNDSGTSNTIFGKNAGLSLDVGSNYNVFIGENVSDAAMNNALYNVGIGYEALSALTTGDGNIAIGLTAGQATQAVSNTVLIGVEAGVAALTSDADGSILIGYHAGRAITSGIGNVAIGYQALDAEDDGDYNTAVGHQALTAQTGVSGGTYNTAVGYQSMAANLIGVSCTALGYQALDTDANGSGSTAIASNNLGRNIIGCEKSEEYYPKMIFRCELAMYKNWYDRNRNVFKAIAQEKKEVAKKEKEEVATLNKFMCKCF